MLSREGSWVRKAQIIRNLWARGDGDNERCFLHDPLMLESCCDTVVWFSSTVRTHEAWLDPPIAPVLLQSLEPHLEWWRLVDMLPHWLGSALPQDLLSKSLLVPHLLIPTFRVRWVPRERQNKPDNYNNSNNNTSHYALIMFRTVITC